jgi:hypothetical protein
MGSKLERQNQYERRLRMKIKRKEAKGKNVAGLKKELGYATGKIDRPNSKSGRDADPRFKKHNYANAPGEE